MSAPLPQDRLSQLFTDPLVVDAFRRAELDGDTSALVPVRPITLAGGAAENMEIVS